MAEWIDDLGSYLSKQRSNKFRLTPKGQWKIKSGDKWVLLPDHYKTGLIMTIIGALVMTNSKSTLSKILSTLMFGLGAYLVLDDITDLKNYLNSFFQIY